MGGIWFTNGDVEFLCGMEHATLLKNTGDRMVPVVLARWEWDRDTMTWVGEDYGPIGSLTPGKHGELILECERRLRVHKDGPAIYKKGVDQLV